MPDMIKIYMSLKSESQSRSGGVTRNSVLHTCKSTGLNTNSSVEKGESTERKKRLRKDFYTHTLYKIWHRCYIDKNEFENDRILLNQKDILALCKLKDQTPHSRIYVVPKKPSSLLSYENALLVDKKQRRFLIAYWRLTNNEDQYIKYVRDFEQSVEDNENSNQ